MGRLVTKDANLYNFVKENKDSIVEYLTKTIPRKSIIHWVEDSVFEIKPDSFDNLEIVSFNKLDYERHLKKEYSYSYQAHCAVNLDGVLRCSETGKYPSLNIEVGLKKDVSDYLLEFYKFEQRNLKIESIFE